MVTFRRNGGLYREKIHHRLDDVKARNAGTLPCCYTRRLSCDAQEKGCVFIEINLDLDIPSRAVVAECFESQEAHDIHSKTPHMATFREEMSQILVEARFENILSDNVTVDVPKYG